MAQSEHSTATAGLVTLSQAVFSRELTLFFRYPVEVAGQILTYILMFGVLVFGGQMVVGQAITNSLEGIIIGYFLWMMAITSYSNIATEIRMEANWGTLERLALTPFGFGVVMLVKSVAKLLISFAVSSLILIVMVVSTGVTLSIDVMTVLPILVLTVASAFGIGFAVGGLTVLYKNIQSWVSLLQLGFIGLIGAPALDATWMDGLPLVKGSAMLQDAMKNGVRLWEFPVADLTILLVSGVGYLVVGYVLFQLCQRRARNLGVLGDY